MPRGIPKNKKQGRTAGSRPTPEAIETAREARSEAIAAEDVGMLAHRMANELQGIEEPKPAPPPPDYPEPAPDDANAMAHLLATQMLQDERKKAEAEREKRRDARESYKVQDRGRIPVETRLIGSVKLRSSLDIVDPETGESLLKYDTKGRPYDTRWVRVKDGAKADDYENKLRVFNMRSFGYETVKLPDGTDLRTETMIAMQAPVEAAARRIIHYADQGSFDHTKPVDRLRERADEINRDFSRRHHGASQGVVNIDTMPGHRTFRGGLNDE